jgi:hypothetical protein
MIKSRKRWVGHVAHMGGMRNATIIWLENMERRGHLEDLRVDRKILE